MEHNNSVYLKIIVLVSIIILFISIPEISAWEENHGSQTKIGPNPSAVLQGTEHMENFKTSTNNKLSIPSVNLDNTLKVLAIIFFIFGIVYYASKLSKRRHYH